MIKTPETHPNHDTVGRYLKGHGVIYYCTHYDSDAGFFLTPVLGEDPYKRDVVCISEAAVDRTFHTIYIDGNYMSCRHTLTEAQREFMSGK